MILIHCAVPRSKRKRKARTVATLATKPATPRATPMRPLTNPIAATLAWQASMGRMPALPSSRPDPIAEAKPFEPPMRYTGSAVKAFDTLHKSNPIPIFDLEHCKDIAKMRR